MILSCSNICKSFGSDDIIKNASFHIEDHEKAAIVGINGAGKSTLLKIIVGELAPDSGEVVLGSGKTLGYLAQNQDLLSHRTIYEEMLDAKKSVIAMENRLRDLENSMKTASGEELETMMNQYSRLSHEFELINGYAWKSEIVGVLKGLGFTEEEFSKQISTLSGGQKTRVSLGKLLLTNPDIILLDLNIPKVSGLEILEFLKKEADYIIDTSRLLTRELKTELEKIFVQDEEFNSMYVTILSFGFKYGIPADSDIVMDVRFLPNPYYVEELRPKTGNDVEIQQYVMKYDEAKIFLNKLEDMVTFLIPHYISEGKNQLVISIGCTGGKHRSVTLANELYKRLSQKKNREYGLKIEHRDIGKDALRGK